MSGFWDSERILGDLQKGSERIRIREVKRRRRLADIRLPARQTISGSWQTRDPVPLDLVGSLAEALTRIARGAASP